MCISLFIFFTIVVCTRRDDFDQALKTINKRLDHKYTKCHERVDVGSSKIAACVKDFMHSEHMMLFYYESNDETSASACKHEMTVLKEISKNKNKMMKHLRHCAGPDDCISSCDRTPYYNVVPIIYGRQLTLLSSYDPEPYISFETLDFIMYQLLIIIQYMAKQGWRHNDIKPANIIWDPITNWLTLVGMTSFSIESRDERESTICPKQIYGTIASTAPEVYAHKLLGIHIYTEISNIFYILTEHKQRIDENYMKNALNHDKSPDAFSVGYIGFRYSCVLNDAVLFFVDELQRRILEKQECDAVTDEVHI
eukprot:GHVL01044827.1.p1 GENE.GHVL01044827.1~~GHVL01044827.1.p1  ORF type:complete len:310 (+),score=38.91 GHVL01044827.1:75-1004(+)